MMDEQRCINDAECRSWLSIFRKFDLNHDGYIPSADLMRFVQESAFSFGLTSTEANLLLYKVDRNGDKLIDFPEFCTLMSRAKDLRMRHVLFRAAQMVIPRSIRSKHFNYLQQYNCYPPPIFMILISIVEIVVYIYYAIESKEGIQLHKPVPIQSPLIFNPKRRYEVWRYFTYMLIHIGFYHLIFNVITQILLGIPLELVHKMWRIAFVYLSGVLAGSLLVSIIDPKTYLAGASGGVYALLAAHIAELLVNWSEMEFAIVRAIILFILIFSDAGVALYQRYFLEVTSKVSYASHAAGFIAGVLMGILVLRNFRKKSWENMLWWSAFSLTISLFTLGIILNISSNLFGLI